MKYISLSAATVVLLVGCSSSPKGFGPAYGSDIGYRQTQVQHDRFRISYTSRDAYESRDFALLRAAQIATNEGYSHFKVVGGDFYDNGPNVISSRIGLGLGSGRQNTSHIDVGVQDVTRVMEGHKATETLDVILLPGAKTQDPNVYSAQSVIKNIVPPNITPKILTP